MHRVRCSLDLPHADEAIRFDCARLRRPKWHTDCFEIRASQRPFLEGESADASLHSNGFSTSALVEAAK